MLTGGNRVRDDVLDENLDERMAPSLGGVALGREHETYADPELFFRRTLITEHMASVIGNVVGVLKGEGGRKILVLNALYGGGKTHSLLAIYHSLKAPHALRAAAPESEELGRRVARLAEDLGRLGKPDVVVIDGYFSELAPSPISPLDVKAYRVRTLWGYLAHALGNYSAMREYDERQVAPDADKLLKLLEDRAVVILVDELAHYIKRFHETPDEVLRRYCSAVESFMEALAKALELSRRAVLVISLPAVERERELVVETTYHAVRQTLENVFKALRRVSAEYVEPIAPRNIPALLRTRLFEGVDLRRARDVQDSLRRVYEESKEVFGEHAEALRELPSTYPFHPLYVETLLDILEKHEGLQKTRDLLRISRKVLRGVLKDRRPYDLVMPWHIDLTRDPLRSVLLIGEYEGFKTVVEEDINERTKLFGERGGLARLVALALLIKTFVYGGGLVLPKIEVLPSERDLALMVYEPALFQAEGWAPKDIVDAVRWVGETLVYVVRDERTGRLWFTRWVTPIKYVEERARRVEELAALNRVLEYAGRLLRETADSMMRRRAARVVPKVFDSELSRASRSCEPVDVDTRRYVLLACLEVPEGQEERRAKLEEVMYKTGSGGTRRYANTIYVTFPSSRARVGQALEWARKLIACEEVEREGVIEKLTGVLPSREAEIAREILKKKLEDYRMGVLQNLVLNTLGVFDRVAYPHYDDDRLANTVKEEGLISQSDSILAAVERSLASTGVGKIKTEMDFDTLDYYLRKIGVDLSEGEEVRTVGTVVDYFYSNPRLPAVPRDAIVDAIRDGVRRMKLGVRAGGRVFFKRIYERDPPQISEGEAVSALSDGDEVLPWRTALEEQLRALRRREHVDERERRVEEYVVRVANMEVAAEEVVENLGRFDLGELRTAPVLRVVRAATVKLELRSPLVVVNPGEQTSVELEVARVGPYVGEVSLRPSAGSVDRERLAVGEAFTKERVTWVIGRAPEAPGDYTYGLEAVDPTGRILDAVRLTLRVSGERAGWESGIPPGGSRVAEMELELGERPSVKPLDVLKKRVGGAAVVSRASLEVVTQQAGEGGAGVSLSAQNISVDDLLALVVAILNRFALFKSAVSMRVILRPHRGEYFVMPELSEDERRALEECRVRYIAHRPS